MTHRRRTAAIVALCYVLGYLLVFAHFVEERHATCVEHGTAHHAEESAERDAPHEAGFAAHPRIEDDHCTLLNATRDRVSLAVRAPFGVCRIGSRIHVTTGPLGITTPRSTAVWRYAPKQSPPSYA